MNVYIDFEMNEVFNNEGDIISIGAIKVDKDKVVDTFYTKVCPVKCDYINPMITVMTGLKYEDLINAPHFYEAFQRFIDWTGDSQLIYCWGTADINSINYTLQTNRSIISREVYQKVHQKVHQIINNQFVDLRKYIELYDYQLSRLSLSNLYQGLLNKKIEMKKLHEPVFDSTLLFEVHLFFKDKLAKEKFHFSNERSVSYANTMQ